MKKNQYSLALGGLCLSVCLTLLSAYAQDSKTNPYVGTWELNVAKSDFGTLPASHIPKSETLVIMPTASDTDRKFTLHGVGGDGKPFEMSFDGATDGQSHSTGGPEGGSMAFMKDGSLEMKDKNGIVLETSTSSISDDGKIFTVKTVHKTADGQMTTTEVYDKVQ
jgi:hypothetical protein